MDMDAYEDYKSPFDFDAGVNANYLYLFPSMALSPPVSPVQKNFGNLLHFYTVYLQYSESSTVRVGSSLTCFLEAVVMCSKMLLTAQQELVVAGF